MSLVLVMMKKLKLKIILINMSILIILKELKVKEYYKVHIKKDNENILEILKTILKRTSDDVLNHYTKMYYFYNKLSLEITNEEIIKEKEDRLELLKELIDNNINFDDFIKTKEKELDLDKQYNEFRKEIFFVMLNKDLSKKDITYEGILYLIDVIREKLCFIAPVNKKYDYIKDEINEILDTKYIRQLILNQVFEFSNLINIFNFIIQTIKKFNLKTVIKKWKRNTKYY